MNKLESSDELELRKMEDESKILPKNISLTRLLPNILTLIALSMGMTSIHLALNQKWESAIIFIIIAAFIDVMDGRLARMLNASSNFGAQLDSLADFLNFGIAPALILFLWDLHNLTYKGFGLGAWP